MSLKSLKSKVVFTDTALDFLEVRITRIGPLRDNSVATSKVSIQCYFLAKHYLHIET